MNVVPERSPRKENGLNAHLPHCLPPNSQIAFKSLAVLQFDSSTPVSIHRAKIPSRGPIYKGEICIFQRHYFRYKFPFFRFGPPAVFRLIRFFSLSFSFHPPVLWWPCAFFINRPTSYSRRKETNWRLRPLDLPVEYPFPQFSSSVRPLEALEIVEAGELGRGPIYLRCA